MDKQGEKIKPAFQTQSERHLKKRKINGTNEHKLIVSYEEWKHAIPDIIFQSLFQLATTSIHNKRLKPGGNNNMAPQKFLTKACTYLSDLIKKLVSYLLFGFGCKTKSLNLCQWKIPLI